MGSLIGKKAFITGAGQGIGKAVGEELIKAGCDIFVNTYSDLEGAAKLVSLAESAGRKADYFQADLIDEESVKKSVNKAVSFLGGLDILINNTGGLIRRKMIHEVDVEFWKTVIDLNLTTMMVVTRECIPYLEKSGGASIVNLASLAGRKGGHPGSLVYSMTKGAVLAWTRALATELGPKGIRVNSVAPGLILGTKFHNTFTTKESAEATIKTIPLGRAGNVGDVARPIVFLASEYDGFITGATIDINGGVLGC
jgi:3-oxoacyl-[acyl-carrier protein] reductase